MQNEEKIDKPAVFFKESFAQMGKMKGKNFCEHFPANNVKYFIENEKLLIFAEISINKTNKQTFK